MTSGNKKSTKTDIERSCMECLQKYLRERLPRESIRWEHLSPYNQDPPDAWLFVGEAKFAAEVTSLVEPFERLGRDVTSVQYSVDLHRLAWEVETQASGRGVSTGLYSLATLGDPPLPRRTERRRLVKECVEYICQTTGGPGQQKEKTLRISSNPPGTLSIQKHADTDLCVCAFPGTGKWPEEIRHDVRRLLETVISQKRRKLEDKAELERCRGSILVLYDAYGFARPALFREQLENITTADWFHSIFLVPGMSWGRPLFLHTKEVLWRDDQPSRRT